MKKEEFLKILNESLIDFPASEREEIVRDQEEYLNDAIASGREEESAVASLGDPRAFASQLKVSSKIDQVDSSKKLSDQYRNVFGAVLAIIALAPFNLIFVMGPFLTLLAFNLAGWVCTAAAFVSALAFIVVFFIKLITFSVGPFVHLSAFFLCLGFVGLAILGFYVMFWITKFFIIGTAKYLRWNLRMIQGEVTS